MARRKVVLSDRLTKVLADPLASAQLRRFIANAAIGRNEPTTITTTDDNGQPVTYLPTLVSPSSGQN